MTPHTSFRLSPLARTELQWLAEHFGLTRTAVLEMLIREKSRSEKRD